MTPDEIAHWPGKTFETGTHPALWHMLDVGAVAERLLRRNPLTGDRHQDGALAFLITLHDLGKISCAFRKMLLGSAYPAGPRHWQHSYRLFLEHDALIESLVGGTNGARKQLYAAVAGHHGGPPENLDAVSWNEQLKQIGPEALSFSAQIIEEVANLFKGVSLDGINEADAKRLGWALCGQTVMADWIGSNTEWFGLNSPDILIADYWDQALTQAEFAIAKAGLFQTRPALDGAAHVLGDYAPRPMQAAVTSLALPAGPMLALIEDATGAGKTEAALILAARMMAAGKGRGLFFALPTMATSNAMFGRLANVASALFDDTPSLGLSHGKAHMNTQFRDIRGGGFERRRDGVTCSDWLADDRRRVLLADIGVGTIDQALLAVLPTRFNTLRLRALSGQILIVDEAHSYDPYMERELRGLLKFHAMLGGSAIVMTATLPQGMRDGFAQAFRQGLAGPARRGGRRHSRHSTTDSPLITGTAYPMLTVLGQNIETHQPDPVPATCREITVHRLTSEAEALSALARGVRAGAACVWVRNAVDDAINAVAALQQQGIEADLLHARFAVADRLDKEQVLQARFGREGQGRAGRVLVATQVVEASLDLDFDLMVSDLAPVGAIIQRAGRLWRHMDLRPVNARPVDGPALHVLSPDPDQVENDRWLQTVLGAGAWVYPADVQWRTARVLFDTGVIRAPGGLRGLIEAVHGDAPVDLPPPLEQAGWQTEGNALTEAQQAIANMPDPFAGYSQPFMMHVFDDEVFPTRLGREQITLRLAHWQGGQLVPWAEKGAFGWQMSEVQISRARYEKLGGVDQGMPDIAALKKGWPDWKQKRVIVAPVGEDGGIGSGLRYDRKFGIVF